RPLALVPLHPVNRVLDGVVVVQVEPGKERIQILQPRLVAIVVPLVGGLRQELGNGLFPAVARPLLQLRLAPELRCAAVVVLLCCYFVGSPSAFRYWLMAWDLDFDPPERGVFALVE